MREYSKHISKTIKDEEEYTFGSKENFISANAYLEINCVDEGRHKYSILKSKIWQLLTSENEVSDLEKKFNELAERWKTETGVFSTTAQKIVNDTFLDILVLGKEIVPFILKDLKNGGPAHWHVALKALTQENPVASDDLGKNKKIRQAWISWGENKKLI